MWKYFYQNEADIPADRKEHYENRDGGWYMKIEGAVDRKKLDEFRDRNIQLEKDVKERDDKLKVYTDAGVDVEKYKTLSTREREIMEGELYKKDKLDEIIQQRLSAVKVEHENQLRAKDQVISTKDAALKAAETREHKVIIENGIASVASKKGLKPGAADLLMGPAREAWKLVDGKPVCYGADGKVRYSNKTGGDLSMDEWIEEFAAAKPFLFEENKGSGTEPGANGSGGSGGSGTGTPPGYNPWKAETWNVTKQMEMTKNDPAKAKQFCIAAGRKWVEPIKPK